MLKKILREKKTMADERCKKIKKLLLSKDILNFKIERNQEKQLNSRRD